MNKAERALNLLRDDFFIDEIAFLKKSHMDLIANSHPADINERENAYQTYRTIELIMSHFQSIADDKKISEKRWSIF